MPNDFKMDLKKIQESARKTLNKGPVTENYDLDIKQVISLLNHSLATELICVLRYKKHYYTASELGASVAAAEFLEHATQEQDHADRLAERIVQLGGSPDLTPDTLLQRSHAAYVDCADIKCMIVENLVAERIAIDTYREVINYLGNRDSTTRRILEEILASEEEHADDILALASEYAISLD